jgi:tripartite-type tricarboxylate transporter receptor subunit TctC
MSTTRRAALAALALALACAATAHAEEFPSHPIHLIVPFTAGGATDFMARSLAQAMGKELKESVVVENRAGAGGSLGATYVAHAKPDGYTLLFSTMGVLTINPSLYANLGYDPRTSFAPIALTHVTSNLVVVDPKLPVHSVPELVALAKREPGKLSFSSSGNGTSSHLSGELFKSMAGIDIQHVPYKGTSEAMNDFLAGRISMMFDTTSNFVSYVKDGRARPLAVTSLKRSPAFPDVPAMTEIAGLKGYEVSLWSGVLAPAHTPPAVISKLNQVLVKVMSTPEMQQYLATYSIDPLHSTPAAFAQTIDQDEKKWSAVVKKAGLQMN